MDSWVIYLLKTGCFHGILVLFYLLFLRRLTFYGFNRFFLLGIILLGLILPLLQAPVAPVFSANEEMVNMIATRIDATSHIVAQQVSPREPLVNWSMLWSVVYGLGVFLLFQRYLYNFLKIRKFRYGYQLIQKIGAIEVFRTPFAQPFSFFKSVYLPGDIEESKEADLVMAHELQHVNFGHSYDRMLVDFIVVLFWFNPFIYLLRKSLIEVHEYQVDAAVASDAQAKIYYQMSLVKMAGGGFSGPVSFFNFSTIKRRIQMMNRNKSKKASLSSLLILVPVVGVMVSLFSFEMKVPDKPENSTPALEVRLSGDHSKTSTLVVIDIPSIFPVSTREGKVRVSSTFGKRKDPFDGQQKYHQGMDVATKEGTPVIATASGEVIEVDYQPNGYGKFIVLQHDEPYTTKYAQLSTQEVKVGDKVKKGQMIGRVGSSGRSTAPHLHYEIRKDGKPVDPVPYISDYKFSQVSDHKQKELAHKQRLLADEQQSRSEDKQAFAEQERRLAEERKYEAERQLALAEAQLDQDEEERILAERQRELYQKQRSLIEHQIEVAQELEMEVQANVQVASEVEAAAEVEVEPAVEVQVSVEPVVPEAEIEMAVDPEPVKEKSKEKSKDKNKSKDKQ